MAKEKRLIDANALVKIAEKRCGVVNIKHIDEQPTVDAVEVVRCKDCKHWLHMEDGFGDCTNGRFHLDGHADPSMYADDFCSCGERREKDG